MGTFDKIIGGYQQFRKKYVEKNNTLIKELAEQGQRPEIMVVACCDSRVDPALLLQCNPGDLFVVRNIANLIPPYENDEAHHGTSAALEFGICYLNIKDLIILGHSQCGGIHALMNSKELAQDDFISNWMNIIKFDSVSMPNGDTCGKYSLVNSYQNCLTFPWLKQRLEQQTLAIHLWFFDIREAIIYTYSPAKDSFEPITNGA